MPFLRGLFDLADISGKRTEYLFIIEMMVNLGAGLVGVLLGVLFMSFGALVALKLFFVILAVFTLLIATPKFALYRR